MVDFKGQELYVDDKILCCINNSLFEATITCIMPRSIEVEGVSSYGYKKEFQKRIIYTKYEVFKVG